MAPGLTKIRRAVHTSPFTAQRSCVSEIASHDEAFQPPPVAALAPRAARIGRRRHAVRRGPAPRQADARRRRPRPGLPGFRRQPGRTRRGALCRRQRRPAQPVHAAVGPAGAARGDRILQRPALARGARARSQHAGDGRRHRGHLLGAHRAVQSGRHRRLLPALLAVVLAFDSADGRRARAAHARAARLQARRRRAAPARPRAQAKGAHHQHAAQPDGRRALGGRPPRDRRDLRRARRARHLGRRLRQCGLQVVGEVPPPPGGHARDGGADAHRGLGLKALLADGLAGGLVDWTCGSHPWVCDRAPARHRLRADAAAGGSRGGARRGGRILRRRPGLV